MAFMPGGTNLDLKLMLLRASIRAQAEGTLLDSEDQEMIAKYHMGEITKEQLEAFSCAKADRLDAQQQRPQ